MKRISIVAVLAITLFTSCTKIYKTQVATFVPNAKTGKMDTVTNIFRLENQYPKGANVNVVLIETYDYTQPETNGKWTWVKSGRDFKISPVPVNLDDAPDASGQKRIANYPGVVL